MYKINNNYDEFISKTETIRADLTPKGLVLKILWKNPEKWIVESLSISPFFHLYFKNDIMFLLLKFEGLDWIDIPCNFENQIKQDFSFDFKNYPCKILLANSNTGKLFLNKTYLMPDGVSKAFIQWIHTQKDFDKKTLKRKINLIQSSYSASEMLRLSFGKHQ